MESETPLINEFVNEWFTNPNWWFNATPQDDEYIVNKFGKLLTQNLLKYTYNVVNMVGVVIAYDQLPRHIKRHTGIDNVNKYMSYALIYANKLVEICNCINNGYLQKGRLSWSAWCFVMIVYRHAGFNDYFLKITECIGNALVTKYEMSDRDEALLRKYLKATYLRYQNKHYGTVVHDQLSDTFNIERYINICDYTPVYHIFHRTLENFKRKTPVIVSLSGGVDSMVYLCSLTQKYNLNDIVAVHINYDNRPECAYEEQFVIDWCAYLGVKCYVRKISEIHRELTTNLGMRELYENYTKQVRFSIYKYAWKREFGDQFGNTPIVVLGHHGDDCTENILTNIITNRYNDLKGMEESRIIDGINFIRPMLNLKKREIVELAYKHAIPYLKDSTYSWCARGKLRDSVIPALNNWNNDAIPGFMRLADTCNEAFKLINCLISTIIDKIRTKDGYITNIKTLPTSELFFRQLFCSLKIYPSNKSIKWLIYRIKRVYDNWEQFKGETKVEVTKGCRLTIYKMDNKLVGLKLI